MSFKLVNAALIFGQAPGIVDGTTIMGGKLVADGTTGGVFVYSSSPPATGNLTETITPNAGANDGHGNPFQQGISSYDPVSGNAANLNAAVLNLLPAGWHLAGSLSAGAGFLTLFSPTTGVSDLAMLMRIRSSLESLGAGEPVVELQGGLLIQGNTAPAKVANYAGLFADSAQGNLGFVSGSDGNTYDTGRLTVHAFTSPNANTVDQTICSKAVGAGLYRYEFWAAYNTSLAGGTPSIGLALPTVSDANATIVWFPNGAAISPTAAGLGTSADSNGPTMQTSIQQVIVRGRFTATASGNLIIKGHTSAAANPFQIADATLDVYPVVAA